ncbi:hypothetical protein SGLAM104S_04101 [Streptomyces glaucescens]
MPPHRRPAPLAVRLPSGGRGVGEELAHTPPSHSAPIAHRSRCGRVRCPRFDGRAAGRRRSRHAHRTIALPTGGSDFARSASQEVGLARRAGAAGPRVRQRGMRVIAARGMGVLDCEDWYGLSPELHRWTERCPGPAPERVGPGSGRAGQVPRYSRSQLTGASSAEPRRPRSPSVRRLSVVRLRCLPRSPSRWSGGLAMEAESDGFHVLLFACPDGVLGQPRQGVQLCVGGAGWGVGLGGRWVWVGGRGCGVGGCGWGVGVSG